MCFLQRSEASPRREAAGNRGAKDLRPSSGCAQAFFEREELHIQELAQQVVSGLATGSIFASLALALVLIYRSMDVINFAQG